MIPLGVVSSRAGASVSGGTGPVAHGSELTINSVGPWTLQGVAKGSESIDTATLPGRGYWLMDTPSEWAPTGAYVYNNSSSNHGGVVPAGGMVIDGYTVPAGTVVAQFRNFSASDFSAQGQAGSYVFRGCRFRNNAIGQSSQFNDYTATYTNRLMYCDIGSTSSADVDWQGAFWKAIGGTDHVMLRNYCSFQYVTFQPNVPNCHFVENLVEDLIYYYGETGPPGDGPLHMACIGSEGGGSGYRVMRNKIIPASPDAGGHTFINGSSIAFEGTNGLAYSDCQVVDNYLSGFNYVILNFGEVVGSTGVVVTGNKVTTKWFTDGGVGGVEQVGPHPPAWGSSGNVKSGNVWADDYGTGGTGTGTPLGSRQYPSGNGPRAGTTAF